MAESQTSQPDSWRTASRTAVSYRSRACSSSNNACGSTSGNANRKSRFFCELARRVRCVDSLPSLDLDSSPSTERQTMRTTGADCPRRFGGRQTSCQFGCAGLLLVAPLCCTKLWQRSQSVLMAVISSDVDDERATPTGRYAPPMNQSKKALPAVFAGKAFQTRSTGLEPAASSVTSWRSNQLIYDPSLFWLDCSR